MELQIYIRDKFRGYSRELIKIESASHYADGGYASVKEMQGELIRRFPNRKGVTNRKIKNGIVRIEGESRLSHRTVVVTLGESK